METKTFSTEIFLTIRELQPLVSYKRVSNKKKYVYFSSCCKCYGWCVAIRIVNRWKWNKKIETSKRNRTTNVPEKIKTEVGRYALIYGTKVALERFNKIYPKYTFLEHPSTIGNSKLRRMRKEKLFSNGRVNQICFQMTWWLKLKQLLLEHTLLELL